MRTVRPLALLMVLAALAFWAGPASAEMKGEVNLFLGQKNLSDSNLDDLESETGLDLSNQFEYGVQFSFGNVDWPVKIAVDILMASSDDSYRYEDAYYIGTYNIDVDTTEICPGVRKYWTNNEKWQPYVGGGLAWVDAEVKFSGSYTNLGTLQPSETFSDKVSDSSLGYWVDGGVMWRMTDALSLGLDVRYSDASVSFDETLDKQSSSVDFDAGGFHYGILFGYRW